MLKKADAMNTIFDSTRLGDFEVKNRIFMAPLTRNRAKDDGVHSDIAIEYYRQRATAGLIISEATQISAEGKGYIKTPGIYTEEQTEKWKEIVDAVHKEGGKIFMQLWHVGRISHTSLQPEGQKPLAPSAVRADTQTYTDDGYTETSEPKAMSEEDIKRTIDDYHHAAQCAKEAGFDGVEIHAANGYLIDQFLRDKTNKREDDYGGDIKNRARFLTEVLESVLDVWPAGRVGIRLSPTGTFNDIDDSDPESLFSHVIDILNEHGIAYLHMVERFPGLGADNEDLAILKKLREQWNGFYIANGDYDVLKAKTAFQSGYADAITFGRPYIANPDLPERMQKGAPLNEPDEDTFYGGGEKGYTDYPFLEKSQAA
jgi:N-ethylmaleimide reductase